MKLNLTGRLTMIVAVSVAATLAVSAPASARTSGAESFDGAIVTSGQSGDRVVLGTVIVARGAFAGTGRVVEIPNRPDDPFNVSRDDLLFPGGTMHLVTTTTGEGLFSVNLSTCAFVGSVQQTSTIEGGTGRFASAMGHFDDTLTARGVAQRDPDGRCSQSQLPLVEVDAFSMRGTLTY
jgi:hypothetical protein